MRRLRHRKLTVVPPIIVPRFSLKIFLKLLSFLSKRKPTEIVISYILRKLTRKKFPRVLRELEPAVVTLSVL